MRDLIIQDHHYPYLREQKGEINHIEDRKEFERAYNDNIQSTFKQVMAALVKLAPGTKHLGASLDIGSGLGGVDILLQQYFKQEAWLLDGKESDPVCIKHDKPFNSKSITEDFWLSNYAKLGRYLSPDAMAITAEFDLITSFGSYCFHYSPEWYLERVKFWCKGTTILIFDVRNRHQDWLETLRANFDEKEPIAEYEKFTRRVFTWKK